MDDIGVNSVDMMFGSENAAPGGISNDFNTPSAPAIPVIPKRQSQYSAEISKLLSALEDQASKSAKLQAQIKEIEASDMKYKEILIKSLQSKKSIEDDKKADLEKKVLQKMEAIENYQKALLSKGEKATESEIRAQERKDAKEKASQEKSEREQSFRDKEANSGKSIQKVGSIASSLYSPLAATENQHSLLFGGGVANDVSTVKSFAQNAFSTALGVRKGITNVANVGRGLASKLPRLRRGKKPAEESTDLGESFAIPSLPEPESASPANTKPSNSNLPNFFKKNTDKIKSITPKESSKLKKPVSTPGILKELKSISSKILVIRKGNTKRNDLLSSILKAMKSSRKNSKKEFSKISRTVSKEMRSLKSTIKSQGAAQILFNLLKVAAPLALIVGSIKSIWDNGKKLWEGKDKILNYLESLFVRMVFFFRNIFRDFVTELAWKIKPWSTTKDLAKTYSDEIDKMYFEGDVLKMRKQAKREILAIEADKSLSKNEKHDKMQNVFQGYRDLSQETQISEFIEENTKKENAARVVKKPKIDQVPSEDVKNLELAKKEKERKEKVKKANEKTSEKEKPSQINAPQVSQTTVNNPGSAKVSEGLPRGGY